MEHDGGMSALSAQKLARGLGWFSIGLGLAEVLAPRQMGKLTGVGNKPFLLRLFGLREIASGIGILTQRRPAGWVWSRVAGDALDLAVLSASVTNAPGRVLVSTAAVAGVTGLDILCGRELCRNGSAGGPGAVHFETSLIINRSPEELFRFWRDFQNLPRFMSHLESVQTTGGDRSHWVARTPAGLTVEWDAEIVNETLNELIAWRSIEGADVDHAGTVRFERATGGRGTILKVKMQYRPLAGKVGAVLAKLFGQSPERQIKGDLLRLRQILEAGEVARTEGQPAGRGRSASRKYDDVVRS